MSIEISDDLVAAIITAILHQLEKGLLVPAVEKPDEDGCVH